MRYDSGLFIDAIHICDDRRLYLKSITSGVYRRGAVQLLEQQGVGGGTQRLSQVRGARSAAVDGALLDH